MLNSVGKACWRCSTVAPFRMIQPCCQPPVAAQLVPLVDLHNVMSRLRLMASLRATCELATRLFAMPFSRADNVASLKFGTASASKTLSTAMAVSSSMSVKPPQSLPPPHRRVLQCRSCVIARARAYLWMYQYVWAFGWSAMPDGMGSPPSSGELVSPPIRNGTVVPSSSVTMPATGDGGKPPPTMTSLRDSALLGLAALANPML